MRAFAITFLGFLVLSGCAGSQTSMAPTATQPYDDLQQPLAVSAVATASPSPVPGRIRNTTGRIGLAQIFDYFPTTGTQMTTSQIDADATRYDMVWGSFTPNPWRTSRYTLPSRYYIPQEDSYLISAHSLSWWQANHPDWILYACDPSGNPTTQIAYNPGVGFPDVPLDMHNPAVLNYQITQSLLPYAINHNYTAVAIDQVIFQNIMVGGNPELGQKVIAGYYGCGVYQNGTFVRRYTGPKDPQYTADLLNWIATLRSTIKTQFASRNPAIFVNHPAGSLSDPNELQLISNIDGNINEVGFSDYGNYQQQSKAPIFLSTVNYMRYLQSKGVASIIIDKFQPDGATVTTNHLEYSIATYLTGNEGLADLFVVGSNGQGYGYGAEQWHQEYTTQMGAPCGPFYGGPAYDKNNPQIYYRRFAHGMVIVNSGSLPVTSEKATYPSYLPWTELEKRPLANPLSVASNDAYVLLTTGNGCS